MRGPYLIILLFFITLVSCKKKTVSWETDWSVPLINDRLSLSDLENDSTLEANGVGGYNVVLSRSLIDLQLDEILAIPDTTIEKAITIAFPSLSVPPGFTISNTAEENDISIADLELKEIHVKSGNIRFRVLNPVETSMNFTVNLPGTVKDGSPFSQSYLVPAGSPSNPGVQLQAYDISGYSFDLTGLNNNKNNLFVSQIDVTSDPNGPTVTMTNTDSIKFYVEFENVVLDHARGYFGQTSLSDTLQQTISAFDAYENGVLDIPNMSLDLNIVNGVKVGARATISSLSSTNANGSTVNLTHPQIGNAINIDPATGSWGSLVPSVNTLSINSSNSNIESFIENLGKSFIIGYQLDVNPYGNISGGWDELFPNSRLVIRANLNMPLQVGMDQLILRDTFAIDIDAQSIQNIKSGSLVLNTKNAFPLSADISFSFINTNGNVQFTIQSENSISSALNGVVDSSTGLMIADDILTFSLSETQMESLPYIENILVRVELNTPNPSSELNEMIDIPFGAFLDLKLHTAFKLKTSL